MEEIKIRKSVGIMKYIIQTIELIIIFALVILSVTTFNKINSVPIIKTDDLVPNYKHIAIVTDDTTSYAYDRFVGGVESAKTLYNIVYEIYEVGKLPLEDVFRMIAITEVEGVILRLSNNGLATEAINQCAELGIFVITIGNDAPDSNRDVYIGTNKFNLGRHAAQLALEAIDYEGNIGILLGSEYLDETSIATNNFVNGVQEVVSKSEAVELSAIKYTYTVRAELHMDALLDDVGSVDVLICTDPVDVNRIIRVLVDRNRVGEIKIIASGDTQEIVDGIEKELIYASIVEGFTEIGEYAVYYLDQLVRDEGVSSYVNVPFETLNIE